MQESDLQAADPSRCEATNVRGERCRKRASRGRFCLTHAGVQNMAELGRRGGRVRTRPGMGGKQLPATLRERLRDAIDEERLAAVLVAGLESESAKERLDVAKVVLAELHASTRGAVVNCTCRSNPGAWCGALEPHGYASRPQKAPGLGEVVALAFEIGAAVVGERGEVMVDGRVVPSAGVPPVEESGVLSVSGDPGPPATIDDSAGW